MAEVSTTRGWDLTVDRGPDWLFVRPHGHTAAEYESPEWIEQVWSLLERSFTYRVVLELDEVEVLNSPLLGQLLWLHKRICAHDGLMRICGCGRQHQQAIHTCKLEGRLPVYRDREDAVMGVSRPARPR